MKIFENLHFVDDLPIFSTPTSSPFPLKRNITLLGPFPKLCLSIVTGFFKGFYAAITFVVAMIIIRL